MRHAPSIIASLLTLALAGCDKAPVLSQANAVALSPPPAVSNLGPQLLVAPDAAPVAAAPTPEPTPASPVLAGRWKLAAIPHRAAASSGEAKLVVDGDRDTEWNPRDVITDGRPQWLAFPLAAPAKGTLAVLWHGHALHYQNFDYGRPRTYEIQASSDSQDGEDGTWKTVSTVKDNLVRSRVELVTAPGAQWVRLRFLTAWGGTLQKEPFIREAMVYEQASPGAPDVWSVYGDSTTAVGLDPGQPETFDTDVTGLHPGFSPMLIPSGTGGDLSGNAVQRLSVGLPTLPRGSVVGLCYGTNDATHGVPLATYKANMQAAIDYIRGAGDQPVLAVLPWSLNGAIASYAKVCVDLAKANDLPPGPDFQAYFKAHPTELEVDQVHPNDVGMKSMQRLWAESGDFRYPPEASK